MEPHEKALGIAAEIHKLAKSPNLPDRAKDHARHLSRKARSFAMSIGEKKHATPFQIAALEKMRDRLRERFE